MPHQPHTESLGAFMYGVHQEQSLNPSSSGLSPHFCINAILALYSAAESAPGQDVVPGAKPGVGTGRSKPFLGLWGGWRPLRKQHRLSTHPDAAKGFSSCKECLHTERGAHQNLLELNVTTPLSPALSFPPKVTGILFHPSMAWDFLAASEAA